MLSLMRLSCVACALLFTVAASARESCPFLRDPAYWAVTPVAPAADDELAIGTLNAYRLFDDESDAGESRVLTTRQFAARVARIARYIARDMGAPMLVGLQEIEDETAAFALAQALKRETGRDYRFVLGDKAGDGEFRNALLVDARLRVTGTRALFARTPAAGKPLHDRLPLVAEIDARAVRPELAPLTVVVVHMKSQVGIDRPRDRERVLAKRRFQATELVQWVREEIAVGQPLVLLGDINAPAAGVDAERDEPMRILTGSGALVDVAPRFLRPSQRWTYRYRCSLEQLDHVLVSPQLAPAVRGYGIARGDTCIRAKEACDSAHSVSDHEGVVVRLR